MTIIYATLIIILLLVSFIGLVYPIVPGLLFIVAGLVLYGLLFTFEHFNLLFWIVQGAFALLLFAADHLANLLGIKRFGGSKAGMWGGTIGLLVGPFVIPVAGILLGPFLGAVLGELIVRRASFPQALRSGWGSLLGFISSVAAKAIIQLLMIGYFLWVIWR